MGRNGSKFAFLLHQYRHIEKLSLVEALARAFEQPLDSAEHRDLRENGWIAGDIVTVRYWLGRILHRNFFRESDDSVKAALHQYFVALGCRKGAELVFDSQAWAPVAVLLQHHVDPTGFNSRPRNSRLVAALAALMADPDLIDSQLATVAKTTTKQIARMSDVTVLRRLWQRRMA